MAGRDRQRRAPEWLLSRWQRALDSFPGNATDRLLLLSLSTFASPEGTAFPGLDALARRSGIHRANVAKRLPTLELSGWIARTATGGGRAKATTYQLVIPETVTLSARPATVSSADTVARPERAGTVFPAKLSRNGQETVAEGPGKLSLARAQIDPRTDLQHINTASDVGSVQTWVAADMTLRQFRAAPSAVKKAITALVLMQEEIHRHGIPDEGERQAFVSGILERVGGG